MNNREIKFRVWDGEKFYYTTTDVHIYPRGMSDDFGLSFSVKPNTRPKTDSQDASKQVPLTLQQFTGKHDCEGVKIYEGDLVETIYPEHSRASVVFDNWTASYRLETLDKKSIPLVIYRLDGDGGGEFTLTVKRVVGHIFENQNY